MTPDFAFKDNRIYKIHKKENNTGGYIVIPAANMKAFITYEYYKYENDMIELYENEDDDRSFFDLFMIDYIIMDLTEIEMFNIFRTLLRLGR